MSTRRQFLTAAIGSAAATSIAAPSRRRPNLIYCFSDEHRWQSMSFTEMPPVQTPNMQRLAREGMQFRQCISNYPVCSPYRAILLTGRWPYETGIIDNSLPLQDNEITLGKAFRAAGYATGYIGKWHLGGKLARPFGFDYSRIWTSTNNHWRSKYVRPDGSQIPYDGYNATGMTDQALEFIDANRQRPFCLVVSWNPPHSNFTDAPKAKQALYPRGSLPWRRNTIPGRKPDRDWLTYQGYHAHISAIDDELGRILDKLDESQLSQDTIIVYSSDHGSLFRSHGVGGKRQPYEESIRVPFLARWPGVIPAGLESDVLFGAIDIMPTLCRLAGIRSPDTCRGLDFSPTMRGQGGPDPESQFIMHISKQHASGGINHPAPLFRGVRTRRYTYALYPDRPWCLFDNREDPYQMHNRIDDPTCREVRADLRHRLEQWLRAASDPFQMPA